MGIKENDQHYIAHTYARFDVVLTILFYTHILTPLPGFRIPS